MTKRVNYNAKKKKKKFVDVSHNNYEYWKMKNKKFIDLNHNNYEFWNMKTSNIIEAKVLDANKKITHYSTNKRYNWMLEKFAFICFLICLFGFLFEYYLYWEVKWISSHKWIWYSLLNISSIYAIHKLFYIYLFWLKSHHKIF